MKVFATPLQSMKEKSSDPKEDDKKHKKKNKKKKKKKKGETVAKKPKSDSSSRFEKLEALSRRLRLCLLKGSTHRRHNSS